MSPGGNKEMTRLANNDYSGQLRWLRLILGKNYRQISAETLAAMVHLKPVVIRGIEAGRRQLNNDDRAHLLVYLGTRWDTETHQWVCASSNHKTVAFDGYAYQMHTQQADQAPALVEVQQPVVEEALRHLLKALSGRAAQVALIKVHNLLMSIAEENRLDELPQ
jgi:hypothetical protein